MPATEAKWFSNGMQGAPAISGTAGALITALDAILVNGFGTLTLSSLVVSGGIATATIGAGHTYAKYSVVAISGASPAGLNGEKRVLSVDATTFTFDATGVSNQTATGTITASVAPLGWTKVFTATNKAVYQSSDSRSSLPLLRVDDTGTTSASLIMYETMSDVDTGTGPAPTTGNYVFFKSSAASGTGRPWSFYGDPLIFFGFVANDGTNWFSDMTFGDIVGYKTPDPYRGILIAGPSTAASNTGPRLFSFNTATTGLIARGVAGSGGAIDQRRIALMGTPAGRGSVTYPNPANSKAISGIVYITEATNTVIRGILPGIFCPLHTITDLGQQGVILSGSEVDPGGCLRIQMGYVYQTGTGSAFFDVIGPWR